MTRFVANSIKFLIRIWALLTLVVLFGAPISAGQSEPHRSIPVIARLISVENGVAPDAGTLTAGLHLDLQGKWKTYWRTPGEAGIPPQLNWDASENIQSVEFQWPTPKRFETFGIENLGYEDEVVFPLRVALKEAGKPAVMRARVDLLVCEDICVPENFDLSLIIGRGLSIDNTAAELISTYASTVPEPVDSSANAYLDEDAGLLTVAFEGAFETPEILAEHGYTTFGKPNFQKDGDKLWAQLPIKALDDPDAPLTLTVIEGSHAIEMQSVWTTTAPLAPNAPRETSSLWMILCLAILGGLILNVMPCVLPVLGIKFASALNHSGQSLSRIRAGFLASAFGVVSFMWLLAVFVLTLQMFGHSVGWGMHFQNPYFLAGMLTLIMLFAANMMGLFEISLPTRLHRKLDTTGQPSGFFGDYLTGMFAAMLATPCTAPFLGTAVTFALSGSPLDVVLIFTALGVGLAIPYLVVAAFPQMVKRLPKPGAWMLWIKGFLGVLLLATALWLGLLLVTVAGPLASLISIGLAALAILLLRLKNASPANEVYKYGAFLALALAIIAPVISPSPQKEMTVQADWEIFDKTSITQAVAAGNTVFVDVTADWCLTCKANKSLVLNRASVATALGHKEIIAMKADWTRPDATILAFLEEHGRYGIPFNIVFGPQAPEGIALPEILKTHLVLDALANASGNANFAQR